MTDVANDDDLSDDLESALLRVEQMVAALRWNPSLHPRGRDGTFIERGGWVRGLFTWDDKKKAKSPVAAQVIGFSEDTDNPEDPFIFVERSDGRAGWARASEVETAAAPKARLDGKQHKKKKPKKLSKEAKELETALGILQWTSPELEPAKPGEMILRSQAEANRAAERPGWHPSPRNKPDFPALPPLTAADLSNPDTPRSREVTPEEFLALTEAGHARLADIRSRPVAPTGGVLNPSKWLTIRNDAWNAVQEEWGGVTVEAATGTPITGKPKRYAMSVKPPGVESVAIPIGSTRAEFDAAMEEARTRFARELTYPQYHLGVFRDEDTGQIDIDPVLVVDSLDDVESIGAYARSVGGAYSFADGNGYWPPHVAAEAPVVASIEQRLAALEAMFVASR
jgi:hypothetical protein